MILVSKCKLYSLQHANSKELRNFVSIKFFFLWNLLHLLFDLASISIEHCKKSFFNQTIWENQFCGQVLLLSIRYLAIKVGTVTGIAVFFQKLRRLLSFWSHLNLFWLCSAPLYDSAMEFFAFHNLIWTNRKSKIKGVISLVQRSVKCLNFHCTSIQHTKVHWKDRWNLNGLGWRLFKRLYICFGFWVLGLQLKRLA